MEDPSVCVSVWRRWDDGLQSPPLAPVAQRWYASTLGQAGMVAKDMGRKLSWSPPSRTSWHCGCQPKTAMGWAGQMLCPSPHQWTLSSQSPARAPGARRPQSLVTVQETRHLHAAKASWDSPRGGESWLLWGLSSQKSHCFGKVTVSDCDPGGIRSPGCRHPLPKIHYPLHPFLGTTHPSHSPAVGLPRPAGDSIGVYSSPCSTGGVGRAH